MCTIRHCDFPSRTLTDYRPLTPLSPLPLIADKNTVAALSIAATRLTACSSVESPGHLPALLLKARSGQMLSFASPGSVGDLAFRKRISSETIACAQ